MCYVLESPLLLEALANRPERESNDDREDDDRNVKERYHVASGVHETPRQQELRDEEAREEEQ